AAGRPGLRLHRPRARPRHSTRCPVTRLVSLGLAVLVALAAQTAAADDPKRANCGAASALGAIDPPLAHAARRIAQDRALTIVAVGSSSTQGIGASAPDFAYPSR